MRILRSVSLLALASCALAAHAAPHLIDFEGFASFAPVGSAYLASDGVAFDGALVLNTDLGTFSNPPSGTGVATATSAFTMSSVNALTGSVGFYYASSTGATVSVYSGLAGTGSLLGSLALGRTPNPFTQFLSTSLSFAGEAHSVVFTTGFGTAGYDDITFTSASAVPGPVAALPFALMAIRRRKRA